MTVLSRRAILAATAGATTAVASASAPIVPTDARAGNAGPIRADRTIRPEAFGAIADGTTDCTTAMLAAIAAATRANVIAGRQRNLPIELSVGVYRLTQPITFATTDIVVTGAGRQNTALLIDHSGPGVVVNGGGDCVFRGFAIDGSPARRRGGTGDGFVCQPQPGKNFTYMLSLIDLYASNHPNNGFTILSPEGLRMADVRASHNGGDGCLLDARGLENICNMIDFARFSENGGCGLNAINIANSIFSRVECLNNRGQCQLRLDGNYNTVLYTDCEAFDIYDGHSPAIGLIVSGKGNIVQGGDFFQLSTAIALRRATDCRVIMPKLEGARGLPLLCGIDIAADCSRTTVDFVDGHLTTTRVRDQGTDSRITAGGVKPLADAAPRALSQRAHDSIVPDLGAGHSFAVIADGPLHLHGPVNAAAGAIFTLVVDSGTHGIGALTFAAAYRGIADHLAANSGRRYLTCTFVAAPDGRCLPQSLLSYD